MTIIAALEISLQVDMLIGMSAVTQNSKFATSYLDSSFFMSLLVIDMLILITCLTGYTEQHGHHPPSILYHRFLQENVFLCKVCSMCENVQGFCLFVCCSEMKMSP